MKIPAKSSANLSKTAKGVTSATHRPRQAFRPNARHDTIHKNISPEAGGFHPAAFCLLQRECIACISPTRTPQGKTALCNATHATKCNACNEMQWMQRIQRRNEQLPFVRRAASRGRRLAPVAFV
jgi:hypothetical protein